jgi:hypothetical protein
VEVLGVVLVDPDPRDRTDGTLWDGGPHHAPGRHGGTAASAPVPEPASAPSSGAASRAHAERPSMPVPRVPSAPDSDQEVR